MNAVNVRQEPVQRNVLKKWKRMRDRKGSIKILYTGQINHDQLCGRLLVVRPEFALPFFSE